MLTKVERRALLAEAEFISERYRLLRLIHEDCIRTDRLGLASLMGAIEQVWRARLLEMKALVHAVADAEGMEIRTRDLDGATVYEVWKDGRRIARSDRPSYAVMEVWFDDPRFS